MLARIIAKGLDDELGQPVIVENRAGAAGTIGTRYVSNAKPDGYTLLAIANTFASVPEFIADAGYNAITDFSPVTQTCSIPMVLVTPKNRPENTIQAFIQKARTHPGEISIGSSGLGSTGYIAAELFSDQAKAKFLHVYYKGNSQALMDVMGGQVEAMFDQVSTAGPNVESGKLQALAVTTKTRSRLLPGIPTLDEAGLPGFEDETFNGMLAPSGTPAPVIARLHAAISKVLNNPSVQDHLAQRGIEAKPSESSEAFGRYLEASVAKYQRIAANARNQ